MASTLRLRACNLARTTPASSSVSRFTPRLRLVRCGGPRPLCMRSASSCVSDRSLQYHPSPTASLDSRLRRGYSTAQSAPSSTSFPDPDRPDLFYHLFEPPTPLSSSVPVFALSFIAQRPSSANSSAVIGWLPASAPGDADDAGLNDFVENETFRHVLHEAIRSALRDNADDIQMNAALQTQQGWMHIHDGRNVPALGRIGDPDDIIASVRVEEGKILSDTYQPMPSYRLCTADGVLQLTDGLAQRLREVLAARGAEAR